MNLNSLNKTEFTIAEFALIKGYSERHTRRLVDEDKLPSPYKLVVYSQRKRKIVKVENEKVEPPKYKHASQLSAEIIVKINNALDEPEFRKNSGKPNISKISKYVNEHYWTVKRFIEGDFKNKDENRADKGVSRKLNQKELTYFKKRFIEFYLENAQKNVALTLWKIEQGEGEKIPQRLAYQWASELRGSHTMSHYYKTFIQQHTPHMRRDNWGETKNFLDVVLTDVWPIDDPYASEDAKTKTDIELDELKRTNKKKWEKQRYDASTAHALAFIDQKTGYPLTVIICPHSVSGSDVVKGYMRLISQWGLPGKWYLDNGKEFVNDETIQFLYGVHSGTMEFSPGAMNHKIVMLKDEGYLQNSGRYQPYGKGRVERQFRIWKDEHCATSPSYSPNQKDSRKPGLALSCVQPEKNFEELARDLDQFVYGQLLIRDREMFYHPGYTKAHEVNQDRPTTIQEAFDRAYSTYERKDVDEFLLAFHYARKFQKTYKDGMVKMTYKTMVLRYMPVESGFEKTLSFSHMKNAITVLMDPNNVFHCWFFAGKQLLCEARDLRYDNNLGISNDRASYMQKLQNAAVRAEKKRIKMNNQLKSIKPKLVAENSIHEITGEMNQYNISVDSFGNLQSNNTKNETHEFSEVQLNDDELDDFNIDDL